MLNSSQVSLGNKKKMVALFPRLTIIAVTAKKKNLALSRCTTTLSLSLGRSFILQLVVCSTTTTNCMDSTIGRRRCCANHFLLLTRFGRDSPHESIEQSNNQRAHLAAEQRCNTGSCTQPMASTMARVKLQKCHMGWLHAHRRCHCRRHRCQSKPALSLPIAAAAAAGRSKPTESTTTTTATEVAAATTTRWWIAPPPPTPPTMIRRQRDINNNSDERRLQCKHTRSTQAASA